MIAVFIATTPPMQQYNLTFNENRNPFTPFSSTTVKPKGFLKSEAILAIILLGPTPTEQVRFSLFRTASMILWANSLASSKSFAVVDTSRYASSIRLAQIYQHGYLIYSLYYSMLRHEQSSISNCARFSILWVSYDLPKTLLRFSFAKEIALRVADVLASGLSITKSCIVARYRTAVTLTPASISLCA